MRLLAVIVMAAFALGALYIIQNGATAQAQSECAQALATSPTYGSWSDDCASVNREGSYARFYTFTLAEETEVTITLESEADTYLFLLDGDGDVVAENDDIEDFIDFSSRVSGSLAAGSYTIEATTYAPYTTGEFTLTVTNLGLPTPAPTPEPTPEPDPFEDGCGEALAAETTEGSWTAGCQSVSRDGAYAGFYAFTLLERTEVSITLRSETIDPYLLLLDGEGYVVAENDDIDRSGEDYDSRIREALEADDYVIEATTYDKRAAGEFTLTVAGVDFSTSGSTPEPTPESTPEPTAEPTPDPTPAPRPVDDRAVLVELYNSTGGANWRRSYDWLSSRPIGEWHGVYTNEEGRVTELDLDGDELSGSIPASLGSLSKLESLSLSHNDLSGSIPASLGKLSNLEILYLTGNDLSGSIPASLGRLSKLQSLNLNYNDLSGSIPSSLGSLSNLVWLAFNDNDLSGSIPASLGNLSSLSQLALNDNDLSGSIPAELGNLSLGTLVLDNNDLSGSIPAELGNLSNLWQLVLDNNDLSGSIPAELGKLSRLEYLFLAENELTGCIPAGLSDVSVNDFPSLGLPFCGE